MMSSPSSARSCRWLDVILYFLTLLSEAIRLRVAEVIANAVAEVGGANVHVMGHSLGTAVVHDTLAKAYGPDNLIAKIGKVFNLSPIEHCLGGVHLVANVSALVLDDPAQHRRDAGATRRLSAR